MSTLAHLLVFFMSVAAGLAGGGLWTALPLHLGFRVAYMLYASWAIATETRRPDSFEARQSRYALFKTRVLFLQNADAMTFGALCVATRGTLLGRWDVALCASAGALLFVVGIGCKAWAVKSLGSDSYTWRDVFLPREHFQPCRSGLYRFFSDPMYTVGYLHAYGFALLCASGPGLAAAAFDQVCMLLFNEAVEKPHFRSRCALPSTKT